MVSLKTSHFQVLGDYLLGDYFFHQSEFFKIYHGTRYSIDEFFSLGSKIKLYEENKNQKNQNLIQLDWRSKTFWKTQFHPNFYTVTDGPDIRSEQFRNENDQHK